MKLIIDGRLPGLNEYIEAERENRYRAAKLKQEAETLVILSARKTLGHWRTSKPVMMYYTWYERDKRRDKDNIAGYGRKVIQDALIKAHYIPNDGWKYILGFTDDFIVDKKRPRIEVVIEEVTNEVLD